MTLGTVFSSKNGQRVPMDPLTVSVTGCLTGTVASFTVRQTFQTVDPLRLHHEVRYRCQEGPVR